TGLLHLPGRGPPRGTGSSLVPCPGCPCRASGAVCHTPPFATAGTVGASHVLRRLASCLPRPEDAGGPPPPRLVGGCVWPAGAFKPSASARALATLSQHCRGRGPPCGLQDTLSTLRPSCAPCVPSRLRHGRKTRYGRVARPDPTGTCTLPETPSFAWRENAAPQLLPEAGAQRTLEAVSCMPLFGLVAVLCSRGPYGTARPPALRRSGVASCSTSASSRMASSVQQTCCPSKTRHDIEIFDGHVCPTLADTIEHRHDDHAVAFVVYCHPKVTVVGPSDGTHPWIGLVVPYVVFLLRLVVYFDKGLPLVELSEQIKEFRPGECLRRKAPADIHNAAHDWDITRREVHAHLS